jgi:alpha-glucosidase (family GH31 glycosyl hydrolase)
MARWVQMGAFSPLLRPHTAGKSGSHRDIWGFPFPAFESMRAFFRLRARLVPYLSDAWRGAYESGVVPVHPLYYDFPALDGAYGEGALHQYKFGERMWVAPITAPAPAWGSRMRATG